MTSHSTSKDAAASGFKQRVKREFIDYAVVACYLAILFSAIVAYTNLVSKKYGIDALSYTFAIVNALVVAKVILIGEMVRIGRHVETRPLYQAVLFKAVLFSVLVFALHVLEEFIKRVYQGKPAGTVLRETDYEQLLGRSIIILCVFVPLFAFRELHRMLGPEKFRELFFGQREPSLPG
jgi:hypothetical protein